jgi:hypothetical protein
MIISDKKTVLDEIAPEINDLVERLFTQFWSLSDVKPGKVTRRE